MFLFRINILLFVLLFFDDSVYSQRVYPLVSEIVVDSILEAKPNASKIALEKISGQLYYTTVDGNIYEIFIPAVGNATDSLRYSSTDHGITYLQGIIFRDSVMYLCGNIWNSTTGIGKIVKGVLQPNGSRNWVDIVTTDIYPTASSYGDHGFAGITISPDGNSIFVSSGSRTHLGEIRDNGGAWPGYREVPLSSTIFKFPVNTAGLILPNDSALLTLSGFVFSRGTRNAYDMAWDGRDTLFAIDNSGERDDPEELNWLREGKHYGFPWRMGGNFNPLMNSPYDADADPLVNPLSGGYLAGWFADDPSFPSVPIGITFTEPVRNFGNSADFYRDSISGQVKNASDEGTYITSFTSHRSPLGLVFDRDSLFAEPYRGRGFVLNFMPGGDSTGYSPISPWGTPCPFVDPARELVMMNLIYDFAIDNYTMTTSDIVEGFYLPVDAELAGTMLYVIENGGDIWRIKFPEYNSDVGVLGNEVLVYPNPAENFVQFEFFISNSQNVKITLWDVQGKKVGLPFHEILVSGSQNILIDTYSLNSGMYFYTISMENYIKTGKIIKVKE